MSNLSGGCLCGAAKYTCSGEPIQTAVCHCEDCQRQSGSAFSVFVVVPADSLAFEDESSLAEYSAKGESGNDVQRIFCKACGSPLLSVLESAPQVRIIKAGTLNDKSWLEPSAQYWCCSAQNWVDISDKVTKFERNPA